MRFLFNILVLLPLFANSAFAGTASTDYTMEFLQEAVSGNLFVIEASQLALQKSKNRKIRQFAQIMIDGHDMALKRLKSSVIASRLDESLMPYSMTNPHREQINMLAHKKGKDFDREYIDTQEEEHYRAIRFYREYLENGEDKELKAYIVATLPDLQYHKKLFDELEE